MTDQYIDLYCERVGSGLWAEPINALTNLLYLVAALAAWKLARRENVLSGSVVLLIALIAAVGIGSALFHTFATPLARVLDVVPILIFQPFYLWVYLRRVACVHRSYAALAVIGLVMASLLARTIPHGIEWSLQYLPAFAVLAGLGVYHLRAQKREPLDLIAASGCFALALFFRTIDGPACQSISIGTHFLWHILTPVVMYLVFRGLALNLTSEKEKTTVVLKVPTLADC